MAKEKFEYGKLLAGEAHYIHEVECATGTYKVGDILEATTETLATKGKYKKATSVALANHYVVCNEDIEVTDGEKVIAIREGYFNANIVKVNDLAVTDNDKAVLQAKNIFVVDVEKQ